jgi:hypothetical protein
MKPTTIQIDETEYVRKDQVQAVDGPIQIVVLDKGFVYVGRVAKEHDGIMIHNAQNIRYWGTKAGLGELVKGPLPTTKLDHVGTIEVPAKSIILFIKVEQSAWSHIL